MICCFNSEMLSSLLLISTNKFTYSSFLGFANLPIISYLLFRALEPFVVAFSEFRNNTYIHIFPYIFFTTKCPVIYLIHQFLSHSSQQLDHI